MANFYVSNAGSDTHSGLSADPAGAFKTLGRAQLAMRANPGTDTAYIRGGTYNLTSPLSLIAADSGSSFVAYAGERPVISGGTTVKGWRKGADGVWTAQLQAADVRQLTVGGVAQTEARNPNYDAADPIRGGWLWAKALPSGGNSTREMAYDKTKLSASQVAPGQRVTVYSELSYSCDSLIVASVDTKAGIIRFAGEADYPIGPASRFFISGGKPQLDQPGEWWFDKASRILSYKAPVGFNGGNAVVAGGDQTLVNIDRASNIALRGLTFTNTTTTSQNEDVSTAAVIIAHSAKVTVDGSRFTNVAQGVLVDDESHHVTISGSDFIDIGGTAIDLSPTSHENLITNNIINRTGKLFRATSAIAVGESWGNTISKNRIQDVPSVAIKEGHNTSTIKSGSNIYEYNEILRSGREAADTSAVYIYTGEDDAALASTIRYNRIIDTGGLTTTAGAFVPGKNFSWGIYLDDYTDGAQVYGNFVSGTVLGGVNVHGGSNNSVYNNVLLDNREIGLQTQEIDEPMIGNVFHHNIVQMPTDDERIVASDPEFVAPSSFYDNIYLNPTGVPVRVDDFTLAEWRAMGGDRGTDVVASVGFVNPAAGDYAFAPDSFALTQGIQQLPYNLIGPTRGQIAMQTVVAKPSPVAPRSASDLSPAAKSVEATVSDNSLSIQASPELPANGFGTNLPITGLQMAGVGAHVTLLADHLALSPLFFDAAPSFTKTKTLLLSRLEENSKKDFISTAMLPQSALPGDGADTASPSFVYSDLEPSTVCAVARFLGTQIFGVGDIFPM